MKKLNWYHTGTSSLDSPRIEEFDIDRYDPDFTSEPFPTWEAAHKNFIKTVSEDIENLNYLLRGVRSLRKAGK